MMLTQAQGTAIIFSKRDASVVTTNDVEIEIDDY
jgi:hypothetical protein